MKHLFFSLMSLLPLSLWGIVDTRSAGYSKTFIDFTSEGGNYPIRIERTYNSRSLYNGLFGFGWCSNIETRLDVLPDGSIKVTECGGGMEILYHRKGKIPDVSLHINSILEELKKRKVQMNAASLEKLKKDLEQSQTLRADFLQALGLKGKAKPGGRYNAKGRANEYITVSSRGYIRRLANGVKEVFSQEGRLLESSDDRGKIEMEWKPKSIVIMDAKGRRLTLSLNRDGKIKTAKFRGKVVASYVHSGEDLVKATNQFKETFSHKYDNLHNLTQNTYPDGTTERLSYNVKKDWVTSFKDRRGCMENYDYGVNKQNSNHYFSHVQKKCGRKVVNKSKYEFWHKNRANGGGRYLHRARAKVNGRLETDVIYHPVFGTPVSFFKNGMRTQREYYANGLLKEKDNMYENIKYSKYNQKCKKPEQVKITSKRRTGKAKVAAQNISFNFDRKCRLLEARKSNDEWVKVRHDSKGRIISMEDQSRKKVTLVWHRSLNKPSVITRTGVGSLRISYDKKGKVTGLKGFQSGPAVIAQVTSVFNSFLQTLSPVADEMAIL